MDNRFCNCLYSIALSVIIAFIFAILYFFGAFSEFIIILAFSLILALLSFLIITILGTSDNGYTRLVLCRNILCLLISIVFNILFNILTIALPIVPGNILFTILIGIAIFFFMFNLFSIIFLLYDIANFSNSSN